MKSDYPYLGQGRIMKTQTQTQTNEAVEALIAHRIEDLDLHPDSNEEIMELDKSRQLLRAAPAMLEALEQATILLKHAWDDPALLHSQLADETAATMTKALEQAKNLPKGE